MRRGAYAAFLLWSCASTPPESGRPGLEFDFAGEYEITSRDRVVGTEQATLRSSATGTRLEGRIRTRAPLLREDHYRVDFAPNGAPLRFVFTSSLAGVQLRAEGRRSAAGFEVELDNLTGQHRRAVEASPGAAIDFASPLLSVLPLRLLRLSGAESGRVETILVSVPTFEPLRVWLSYAYRGRRGRLERAEIRPERGPPIGLWLDERGIPVRVRTWSREGTPYEMRLRGVDFEREEGLREAEAQLR